MSEKSEEIKELIDKIRGTTPANELQKKVEAVIKEDETKIKAKAEVDKKKLDDIKAAEKKLKEDAVKEVADKKEADKKKRDLDLDKKKKKKSTGQDEEEKSEDEEEEQEEDDTEAIIKKLTETMDKMAEEIAALKKRKNYRTKPPKADKVSEVDDFIKQNITKDFEMVV